MSSSTIMDVFSGKLTPDAIDTSNLILGETCKQAFQNLKVKIHLELVHLGQGAAQLESAEFHRLYSTKAYELEFIDYLLKLSESNITKQLAKRTQR